MSGCFFCDSYTKWKNQIKIPRGQGQRPGRLRHTGQKGALKNGEPSGTFDRSRV